MLQVLLRSYQSYNELQAPEITGLRAKLFGLCPGSYTIGKEAENVRSNICRCGMVRVYTEFNGKHKLNKNEPKKG